MSAPGTAAETPARTAADAPVLAVVDGYSSGSRLPGVMAGHGWRCVHVAASDRPPDYYLASYDPGAYAAEYAFDGDLDALVASLETVAPAAVLPGTETGVPLADRLAERLGLPGNDPATSPARRDKYEMGNRIVAAGLRGVDQYLAADVEGLLAWAGAGSWPVVVKPQASAGTDSVTFCDDPAALEATFRRLHGSTNRLGEINRAVLAQRLLVGQEYFVNGISGHGHHIITEVWRTDKIKIPGAGLFYDRSVLVGPADPSVTELVSYVHGVLDALGVRFGANHTEVMVTDDGPVLIECASRPGGGINPPAVRHVIGASQIDLLARLVIDGAPYVESLAATGLPPRAPLWQIQFMASRSGTVRAVHTDALLAELDSHAWIQRAPEPGDAVERTTDLFTSPGILFLSHDDPACLQRDYETVRAWERDHRLFVID